MAVNKVVMNGETLITLASDTVSPETLIEGNTAHNAAGEAITGEAVIPTKTSQIVNDSGFVSRSPYAPFFITAIPDTNTVFLIWDKVANAAGYVVKSGDGSVQYTERTITANSTVISGLESDTEYSFAIYSYIGEKWYGPSETVFATTFGLSTGALFEEECRDDLPVFDEKEVIKI